VTNPILFEPATVIADRIRARELSCAELVSSVLDRIEALNTTSHSFITVTAERALREARAWDDGSAEARASAPFVGAPLAVKDVIDVADAPTTGGSRVLFDNFSNEDAAAVAALARCGAIVVGKTNLHEFAYGTTGENAHFGTCANAYDRTRLACGSSSGSAIAVALGLSAAGLGTDTGGSVRVPAVMNGLVGFKPSYGLVPNVGVLPFSWTLDHVGFITRTVEDSAALLATFSGTTTTAEPEGSGSLPLAGIRLGIPTSLATDRMDNSIRTSLDHVMRYLAGCGVTFVDVSFPDLAMARTVSLTIQMPEALSFHSSFLEQRRELYGADLRAGLALGQFILAEHYLRAKRLAVGMRHDLDRLFDSVEAILTPATPIVAPKFGISQAVIEGVEEPIGNALTRYTSLFNVTGHPAIALPTGLHPLGVPMGVQLVGPHFKEGRILGLAKMITQAPAFRIPPPQILDER
jgi:aspartyl-tRNA(Asn)/glutamyl-tRNA(Gln) amidotransferase subunit A